MCVLYMKTNRMTGKTPLCFIYSGLQIRYVAVIAVSGVAVGVLASFAVWLLRRKISTFISQYVQYPTRIIFFTRCFAVKWEEMLPTGC